MSTEYDHPPASDGFGGPHPLAGVPAGALRAARRTLREADHPRAKDPHCLHVDRTQIDPVADAVLSAGLQEMSSGITVDQIVTELLRIDGIRQPDRKLIAEYERKAKELLPLFIAATHWGAQRLAEEYREVLGSRAS